MKPGKEQMAAARKLAREAAKVYADNVGDFIERGLTFEVKSLFGKDGHSFIILSVYPSVEEKAWDDVYSSAFCYTAPELYTAVGLLREKLDCDYFGDVRIKEEEGAE